MSKHDKYDIGSVVKTELVGFGNVSPIAQPPVYYGLMVTPMPTEYGTTVYAEVHPASPLIIRRYDRFPWIMGGRTWKEPLTRWWFEIHETSDETKKWPDNIGSHHYEHDGGAMTLRQAILKAGTGVDAALEALLNKDVSVENRGPDAQF